MAEPFTKADPTATGWAIRDPIVRLRRWGTEQTFDLDPSIQSVLGAAPEATIQISEPDGRISRRHASLAIEDGVWTVRDLDSTNGIQQDGEPRRSFALVPGVELSLGGVTLIAESPHSIALHALLQRLMGWSAERLADVDQALRAVREAANLRAVLVLAGEGSLSGVVARLHRSVLGRDRALVVRDPKESGIAAMDRATDGMLVLDASALPDDLEQVLAGLRLPNARVRLVVCARTVDEASEVTRRLPRIASVVLTPIEERQPELDRLLESFAHDAADALGTAGSAFRPLDCKWIRDGGAKTLEEIEEVTRRVVALRNWGVTAGAERLGITHGALSRWASRRRIPT